MILQTFIDLGDRDRIELAAADLEIAAGKAEALSKDLRRIARLGNNFDDRRRISWAAAPLEEAADYNDDHVVSHLRAALEAANEALAIIDPEPAPDMPIVL